MEHGHSRERPIDTIGTILFEEVHEMMTENEMVDRERYAHRLKIDDRTTRYRSSEPQVGQKRSSPSSSWRHSIQMRLLGEVAMSSRKSIAVCSSTPGP